MHLEKLPSGRWRAAVRHKGRRRSITAPTRSEAQRLGAELLLELGGQPSQRVTVAEMIDMHLTAAGPDLAPGTLDTYRLARARIPDTFANRQITEVTAPIIDALYRQLTGVAGWTPHQLHRLHAVLGVSWTTAIRSGFTTTNPVRYVARPRIDPADIHPPAPDIVTRLLNAADPDDRVLVRLAASTGARRGELVGLQWADVRFDTSELVIRRSLAATAGGRLIERGTKTGRKGQRVISAGQATMAELRRHRTDQLERAVAAGLPAPVWVLSLDAGVTPWRPDFATRRFEKLRTRCDVTGVRLHDLRHFVATEMLAAGHTPTQVAGRLGHANPATTTKTYAHWVRAHDQTAAEELDRRIG